MKFIKLLGKHARFKYAIVDDEDFERVCKYRWHIHVDNYGKYDTRKSYYYAIATTENGYARMHRFIMDAPSGMDVDHRSGDTLDNRKENLRICTRRQNVCNSSPQIGKTSKYKGVCWNEPNSKWLAQINCNNEHVYIGLFEDEAECAKHYDFYALKYFGEFAYLNFPEYDYTKFQPINNKKQTTSNYKGVHKHRGKWRARVICYENGKRKDRQIGRYDTEIEAAIARDKYIIDNNMVSGRGLNFEVNS